MIFTVAEREPGLITVEVDGHKYAQLDPCNCMNKDYCRDIARVIADALTVSVGESAVKEPNSDELIAAIQARWDCTDIELEKAGEAWHIVVMSPPTYARGATLPEALSALYLALAEEAK